MKIIINFIFYVKVSRSFSQSNYYFFTEPTFEVSCPKRAIEVLEKMLRLCLDKYEQLQLRSIAIPVTNFENRWDKMLVCSIIVQTIKEFYSAPRTGKQRSMDIVRLVFTNTLLATYAKEEVQDYFPLLTEVQTQLKLD